ncbi:hypothetical protein YYC_04573 [Plasmodium yoelii 17X]|uniref:Uncharacterized protein n=4 Tax=Plasmodium yoelii TaxID=5861 RepID=A0AAE9WQY7_PLAYO|nr:conserved Plasmodium protein, unknown function [Plasmodium yoelii]EAA18295.1 hypothetical protein [Plasmodium yoelii yoelii]ETB57758.1 hypothetical protein YYC_04573 [Plasmodium yoelii 17X]WBY57396.1 hypothetical protein Py17XNL_000900294 [Plasmodium yoelii yoelii]CDU18048.1 conserved Plasmodium protein, unknown function [Plasmodium yoelii]VTZ78465.1 conserved Plasmodium protein, unknown function [Plasmodium yoelii]|eukprot:XP_726730.1 conserved Plasmodium protein, unknown function [Plasmodium yoelii]
MRPCKVFPFFIIFLLKILNIICIKYNTPKIYVNYQYNNPYQNGKYNKNSKHGFIGFTKKSYYSVNLNKNTINKYKEHVKKGNNLNTLYLQDQENGRTKFNYNSLNTNNEKLEDKLTPKVFTIFSKKTLTKFFCLSSICLSLYPAYKYIINKNYDLWVSEYLKEKISQLNLPPKLQRYFFAISIDKFKSSPFFLSSILIGSYSLYIILKVYIEKYREAKRIKTSIDAYNKHKDEYINTGKEYSNENYDKDNFENMDEDDDFNNNFF